MSKNTIVLVTLLVAGAAAAEPGKTAEQQYKNIQVLKGIAAGELDGAMEFISASLGVGCDYCHVQAGPEKDDKKTKKVARKMITMAEKINHDFFGGNQVVTCASCHAGRHEPLATPPLERPREESTEGKPLPSLTVKQILDQFVLASGGKAWDKLRTRDAKGAFVMEGAPPFPLEVVQAAPGRMLTRLTFPGGGTFELIFDGKSAWKKSPRGSWDLAPADTAEAAREAQFAPAAMTRGLADAKLAPDEPVGAAPAHVVVGKRGPLVERMFFDAKSGLLLRRLTRTPTALGELVDDTRFEDYRAVDGVKEPFVVRHNRGGETRSEKFDTIQHNQPVDDKQFAR